jgi:hypothetical protein
VKIENRQQVLAIGAIALISLFLIDRLLVRTYMASWKARSENIAKLEKQIREGEGKMKLAPILRNRWGQMKTNTFSLDEAERRMLEAVQRWSRASDVSISSILPQPKRGDEEYMTMECHVTAAGPVRALAQFLYQIEKDPMALRVEAVEIQSRDEAGQNLALSLQVSGLVLGTFEQ